MGEENPYKNMGFGNIPIRIQYILIKDVCSLSKIVRAHFAPKDQMKWSMAQRVQNNEFVKSGLEIELSMS